MENNLTKKTNVLDEEYYALRRMHLHFKKEVLMQMGCLWNEKQDPEMDAYLNDLTSDEFAQEYGEPRMKRLDADTYDLYLAAQEPSSFKK